MPTISLLSSLPLRHRCAPHRHRQPRRTHPLRRHPCQRRFPHLQIRRDQLFPRLLLYAYYPTFSRRFRSFLSARVAVTAVLPHEPPNPTSYSRRIQPNRAYKTRSVTCLYSGHTPDKYPVTCSCRTQPPSDNQ